MKLIVPAFGSSELQDLYKELLSRPTAKDRSHEILFDNPRRTDRERHYSYTHIYGPTEAIKDHAAYLLQADNPPAGDLTPISIQVVGYSDDGNLMLIHLFKSYYAGD